MAAAGAVSYTAKETPAPKQAVPPQDLPPGVVLVDGNAVLEMPPYTLGDPLSSEVRGFRVGPSAVITAPDEAYESFQSINWMTDEARECGKLVSMRRTVEQQHKAKTSHVLGPAPPPEEAKVSGFDLWYYHAQVRR